MGTAGASPKNFYIILPILTLDYIITSTIEKVEKGEKIIKKLQNWFHSASTTGISNITGEKKKSKQYYGEENSEKNMTDKRFLCFFLLDAFFQHYGLQFFSQKR